jgi:integrase
MFPKLSATKIAEAPFYIAMSVPHDESTVPSKDIQKRHLRPSGCCVVACPTCGSAPGVWCWQDHPTLNGARLPIHEKRKIAAGRYGAIGWHTFRHTYRSWLDETGAPMKVQQELMRHASIQTTVNVYGQAMSSSKREANGKVVEMVLKPVKASA